MKNDHVRVLYIAGVGRTGSTIIERTLGQMDEFVSIGELRFFWEKQREIELCGCGKSFNNCLFWNDVVRSAFGSIENLPLQDILRLRDKVERSYLLPRLTVDLNSDFDKKVTEFGSYYLDIYRAISQISGNKIIIDSSKDLRTLFTLKRIKGIDLAVIHLVRNPNGVAYSWTKKKKRLDIIGKDADMLTISPFITTWRWIYKNLFLFVTRRSFKQYLLVRYEDFAAEPQRTIAEILEFVGVERSIDFIQAKRLTLNKTNHTVSGNPFRFTEGEVDIAVDDSWKEKLPVHIRFWIDFFTWPLQMYIKLVSRN
jgi:hypothetical protein